MLKTLLKSIFIITLIASTTAKATTLHDVLKQTQTYNPTIKAKKNEYKAYEQNVSKAFGGFLPYIGIYGQQETSTSTTTFEGGGGPFPAGSVTTDSEPLSYGMQLEQPLFAGGKNYYAYKSAKRQLQAQEAILQNTEQQILTSAAEAYIDVQQKNAEYDLIKKSKSVISQQLKAAQARFKAGSASKTDILRAKASLASVKAEEIKAEGALKIAETHYESIVGEKPNNLKTIDDLNKVLPKSMNTYLTAVEKNNPILRATAYQYEAAQDNVGSARGSFMPEISLKASYGKNENLVMVGAPMSIEEESIGIYGTMPLFAKGQNIANVRQAMYSEESAKDALMAERNNTRERALRAWQTYQSARIAKEAYIETVNVAETALKGVKLEAKIGRKSIIDFLEAEEEYLSAEVGLLQAEKAEFMAAIELLNTMGDLSLKYFK